MVYTLETVSFTVFVRTRIVWSPSKLYCAYDYFVCAVCLKQCTVRIRVTDCYSTCRYTRSALYSIWRSHKIPFRFRRYWRSIFNLYRLSDSKQNESCKFLIFCTVLRRTGELTVLNCDCQMLTVCAFYIRRILLRRPISCRIFIFFIIIIIIITVPGWSYIRSVLNNRNGPAVVEAY